MAPIRCALALFAPVAASYDEERALAFAKLAGAAYCHRDSLESWSCGYKCIEEVSSVQTCQGIGSHAFVGHWEDGCVAGFQGSGPENLYYFVRELQSSAELAPWDICEGCSVGRDFRDEWSSLRECVMTTLRDIGCAEGSKIRTTGHSLGAATSSLASFDLSKQGWKVVESYDFGKPRVGDARFVEQFNELMSGRSWRVTRKEDPVPNMPPGASGFEHTEPEVYYRGSVDEGYDMCKDSHQEVDCIEQYQHFPDDVLMHVPDHISYLDIETSHRGCDNGATEV
jgi:hypothetical protein